MEAQQPAASPAPGPVPDQRYTYIDPSQGQPVYYQTMMQPQQVFRRPPRAALYSRPWNIAKIVLRSFDLVCCIVVLALSLFLIFTSYRIVLAIIFSIPGAGVVFLWETAELITLCARGGKLGIHPGAHVGLHLVFWLFLAVGVGFYAAFAAYDYDEDYYSYYYDYSARNRRGGDAAYAVLAFMSIMALINFILFVRACVETNQVNRQNSAVFVMPVGSSHMVAANPQHMSMVPPQAAYMYAGHGQAMQPLQPRASTYDPSLSTSPQAQQGEAKLQPGDENAQGTYMTREGEGAAPIEYYTPGNTYGQR